MSVSSNVPHSGGATLSFAKCGVAEIDLEAAFDEVLCEIQEDGRTAQYRDLDFSGNGYTGEHMGDVLRRALDQLPFIEGVLIGGNRYSAEGLSRVRKALGSQTRHSLEFVSFQDSEMAAFPPVLYSLFSDSMLPNLRRISLDSVPQVMGAFKMLQKKMRSVRPAEPPTSPVITTNFTSLSLSKISMSRDDLLVLADLVASSALTLTNLNISDNNLRVLHLVDFFAACKEQLRGSLHALDIGGISFFPAETLSDVQAVAEHIRSLTPGQGGSLKTLRLQQCFAGLKASNSEGESEGRVSEAIAALCAMCGHGTVQRLDVRRNKLSRSHVELFLQGLWEGGEPGLLQVESLQFDYNRLSYSASETRGTESYLAKTVAECDTLTELYMTGTKLTSEVLRELHKAIVDRTCEGSTHPLTVLSISKNHMKDLKAFAVVRDLCVDCFPHLQRLSVDEISCLKPENDKLLAQIVAERSATLSVLTLGGNFMKGDRLAKILDAAKGGCLSDLEARGAPRDSAAASTKGGTSVNYPVPHIILLLGTPVFCNLRTIRLSAVSIPMSGLYLLAEFLRKQAKVPGGLVPALQLDYTYAGADVRVTNQTDQRRLINDPFCFFPMLRGNHVASNELKFANLNLSSPEACDVLGLFATLRHQYAQTIDLSNCSLNADGISAFLASLFFNGMSAVVKLVLTNNPLLPRGVACVRRALLGVLKNDGLSNFNELEMPWYEADRAPAGDTLPRPATQAPPILHLTNRRELKVFLNDVPEDAITSGVSLRELQATYFKDPDSWNDGGGSSLGEKPDSFEQNLYSLYSTVSIRRDVSQELLASYASSGSASAPGQYSSAQSHWGCVATLVSSQVDAPSPVAPPRLASAESYITLTLGKSKFRFKKADDDANLLGMGSHGKVYLGMCLKTSKEVAVKTMFAAADTSGAAHGSLASAAEPQLVKEAALMKKLCHANVVQFYGCVYDAHDGSGSLSDRDERSHPYGPHLSLYIVMERMDNSIIGVIQSMFDDSVVDDDLVCLWGRQILSGLEYLHVNLVVHRDVKPANILFDGKLGVCKISDFSCSQVLNACPSTKGAVREPAGIRGTPAYIAPEVLQTGYLLDFACDIWSLGCTLLEFKTGAPPWMDKASRLAQPGQILSYIASCSGVPNIPTHINPAIRDTIATCLAREPAARPSVSELLQCPFFAAQESDSE